MTIGSVGSYAAPMSRNDMVQAVKAGNTEGISPSQIRNLKQTGAVECSTCASRKYKDGSDEMVSYKAAAHISPESSAAKVRAHEQEHVNNAYSSAAKKGGKVIQASVTLKMAVCPECGKSYTAGGLTSTMIKYDEDSPYGKEQKSRDYGMLVGQNVDETV
ncbi:MAG: hypothetical protein IJB96_12640 [Lachnospira sp.]|nr:hypothetical protein [Lachnospira sp.]